MKLSKLAAIFKKLNSLAVDIEVRVYQDGQPPLDIDHLEVMLDSTGDVSEVWLEVT